MVRWNLCKSFGMSCAAVLLGTSVDAQQLYMGSGFQIEVPDGYEIEHSMPSQTDDGLYESMLAHSPDRSVSFYVFAPRVGGYPYDILLKPTEETLVDESATELDGVVNSWWTIKSNGLDYSRSYHSRMSTNEGMEVTIFGIKYSDGIALEENLDAYRAFKSSFARLPEG